MPPPMMMIAARLPPTPQRCARTQSQMFWSDAAADAAASVGGADAAVPGAAAGPVSCAHDVTTYAGKVDVRITSHARAMLDTRKFHAATRSRFLGVIS